MTAKKKGIEELMNEIVRLEKPAIFQVGLSKHDYSTKWTAYADLRADVMSRSYSTEADTPEHALEELLVLLKNLICPRCQQFLS